jgi:hypothetical protein
MSGSVLTGSAIAAATLALLAACGGSSRVSTGSAQRPSVGTGERCVPAPIHDGPPPRWTVAAWADSSPGFRVPYSLATGDVAGAFFFAPRLRAGHPNNPSNKVLWIVGSPRDGNALDITARLGRDPARVVRISLPADSSPGEIYPSDVDLPTPGCWRLELAWGRHRASLDIQVHRA